MKLLHVDDDPVDLELADRHLRRLFPEIEIESATTLASARQALQCAGAAIDVLLLDLDLPDGDGLELLVELRDKGSAIATVVLTGHDEDGAVRRALKAGADDFLVKEPGYFAQLGQAVRSAQRKAGAKVIANERRFRALFERTPAIAVQGYDRHRRVICWNRASEQLYGYTAAEAIGCRLEDLIVPPAMRETVATDVDLWVADRDRAIAASELTRQRKDGTPAHVFSSHVLLDGPAGDPELYCIDVDLNAQRQAVVGLEASEARYRQLVENVREVIFHLDADGRLSFVNRAWETLTGDTAAIALGREMIEFLHPEDHERCRNLLAALTTGAATASHCEFRIVHRSGGVRWVEGQAGVRVEPGHQPEVFGALMDVTGQVRARRLQEARNEVLGMIVADCGVSQIMDSIVAHIETICADLIVTVMLFDRDNRVFDHAFCRSLPDFYRDTLIGMHADEDGRCCGKAVCRGSIVIADDLQQTPDWGICGELTARAGLRSCWSMPFKDDAGEVLGTIAVHTSRVHVPDAEEKALIGGFANLASVAVQKRQASEQVRRHESALEQSAHAVLGLMRESDFDAAVNGVLETIGEVADVDRVYLIQRTDRFRHEVPAAALTHEWVRDGVEPQLGNPLLADLPIDSHFRRWYDCFVRGEIIRGDTTASFPHVERILLESQGVKSVLAVPVFVEDEFWGLVGFDQVRKCRRWYGPDESVLRIIAASIGAAIERRRSLEKLRLWAAAFESTRDGVVITDLEPRIVAVNRAYTEITGYGETEAIGKNPSLLRSGVHSPALYRDMWLALGRTGHWQGEIWNRRRSGEVYPQLLNIATVRDRHGRPSHYVGVMTDISELKQSEAQLQQLAHYDQLTGLPNRTLALLRLERAVNHARRQGHGVGVLFIDLDRFKNINDSFGHPVGDELLALIGERLSTRVRAEDTLARLGGDEFLLVLERLEDPGEAGVVAGSLIALLEAPFALAGGQEVYVGSSVGISIFPRDSETPTGLIQHADAALYRAKAEGRKTFSYFTAELGIAVQRRIELETRLRRAIEREELVLHYQPRVAVVGGGVVGCEALIRWQSPHGGLVSPLDFIPVAEETGLIEAIGDWVVRTACLQAVRWDAAGLPRLGLSVNLSGRQLWQAGLPARIASVLQETGLDPERLELELTESVIMGQETLAAERFGQLKSLGVKLAIDDFGTGYSSLAYLKRFPIDVLKIDRSFVRDIPDDANDMEIAAAIVAMARALRLTVVAEGVETSAQLAFFAEKECDAYQGYLFSPPVTADAFERLLLADAVQRS